MLTAKLKQKAANQYWFLFRVARSNSTTLSVCVQK